MWVWAVISGEGWAAKHARVSPHLLNSVYLWRGRDVEHLRGSQNIFLSP